MQVLWAIELVETHKDKAYEECSADLQVDMVMGAIVECVLTCLCRVISKILAVKAFRCSGFVDATFATVMVVLGKGLLWAQAAREKIDELVHLITLAF